VGQASKETIIIANGFSCREQIRSTTDRKPLHLVQVMKMAIEQSSPWNYPEHRYVREKPRMSSKPLLAAAGIAAGVVLLAWKLRKIGPELPS